MLGARDGARDLARDIACGGEGGHANVGRQPHAILNIKNLEPGKKLVNALLFSRLGEVEEGVHPLHGS